MDFLAHTLAQRGIDELVPLHAALALEGTTDDQRLEMLAIAGNAQLLAFQTAGDVFPHLFRGRHISTSTCGRA